jgi:putative ABC transport system permease protein
LKKLVIILFILASIFSFVAAYNQTDKEEFEKMVNVEENIARQFVIPNDLILSSPEEMFPILQETAEKLKINIFRKNINIKENNKTEVLKYILITSKTKFYAAFNLKNGRYFENDETLEGSQFLSSSNSYKKNQIGIIKDFGNNNLITIKPLKTCYERLTVYGYYYAETTGVKEFNSFLEEFTNNINEHFKTNYTTKDFINSSNESSSFTSSGIIVKYINYLILLIALILLIYYIFNMSKRIGVFKLHGISNIRLWYQLVGKLATIIFIGTTILILIFTIFINGLTFHFIQSIILYQLKTYLCILTVSVPSYLYISRIKVNYLIKNRSDTNSIFILNIVLKTICSIALVFLFITVYNEYSDMATKQKNIDNWEKSKDFALFYPVQIGYDQEDLENNLKESTSIINGELYQILNEMGSVLINARSYEETALLLDKDYTGIRSIKVNKNYLQEFPVYDKNNKKIDVFENSEDWILLVPEKYYNKKNVIMDFFKKDRIDSMEYEEDFYKKEVPTSIKNQKIKIIWTANNQKIFSFNPDVFTVENNVILDPVIQVITDKNSLLTDRDSILGNGGTDPLKIKLINGDTTLTYNKLKPYLKQLKLDDNLIHLITVDQFALEKIYEIRKSINELVLICFVLIFGLLTIIIQNLTILFNKYKRRFVIRKLFGAGFSKTYKEIIFLFMTSWIIQIIICSIINGNFNNKLFFVVLAIMLAELIATTLGLLVIEGKNKIKVLKGGT